ncbi:F-box protein CPR1-like [Salvia miltiorrhiza]|uniref:F-box protein CPR1-like n=1 Tax=Salvia miltiorrhiza TaxID=226208 RepID=UPI0025ACB25B|nr:F-box protein CPR1-like [Salvia miltiorrhiza]
MSRLPVKSLMRFKSVCKSWNNLISESRFSKLHLQRSMDGNRINFTYLSGCDTTLAYEASTGKLMQSDDDDDVALSVLAYCNGLFCIALADDLFLFNPCSRKARKIPNSPVEFPTGASTWASVFFGLGHRAASDDYQLVRISMFGDVDFSTEVKIYSRNSEAWRVVGDFPYDYPLSRPGVFAAGCLHWIVSVWDGGVHHHRVALLDLEDDSYRSIQLPDFGGRVPPFFDIGALDGKLVVFYYSSSDGASSIWILEEHGRAKSWTRIKIATDCVSSLEAFVYFQPLCFLKPGRILVRLGAKMVAGFHVAEKRYYNIYMPHILECQMVSFLESLVSPDALL